MVPERGEKEQLVQRAVENALGVAAAGAGALAGGPRQEAAGAGAAAGGAEPADAPDADRVLRHLEHPGDVGGGLDGGVRGRASEESQEYRRFRIKGVTGANDFAMMQEVLKRRFWRVRRETEGEGANEAIPDVPETTTRTTSTRSAERWCVMTELVASRNAGGALRSTARRAGAECFDGLATSAAERSTTSRSGRCRTW